MSWGELFSAAVRDRTNPPLFYALLKVWIGIGGESVAWMRLLPCLAGIAAAVPLVALARRFFEPLDAVAPGQDVAGGRGAERVFPRARIAAAVTIAVAASSPLLVFLSNELRGYSLMLLFSTASLLTFAHVTDAAAWLAPGASDGEVPSWRGPAAEEYQRRLMLLGVTNTLLIYTHYFGWLLVVAEVGAALFWHRRVLRPLLMSALATAAAFAPWALTVLANMAQAERPLANVSWISDASLGAIPGFYDALVARVLTPGSAWIGAIVITAPLGALVLAAASGAGVGARPAARTERGPLRRHVLQLAWFAGFPVLAVYLTGVATGRAAFVPRYLVVAAPAWWLLVGMAATYPWRALQPRLSTRWAAGAAATVVAFTLTAGTLRMVRGGEKIAWDELVGAIAADAGSRGGTVYTLEGFTGLPLAYYARIQGTSITVERFGTDPALLGPAWLVERSDPSGGFRPPDRPLLGWQLGLTEIQTLRTPSHAIRVYRIDPR